MAVLNYLMNYNKKGDKNLKYNFNRIKRRHEIGIKRGKDV